MGIEQEQAQALREFIKNIARLPAFGDRRKDGTEVLWDETYAPAQLWEIIYNTRLLSGAFPSDSSAFHTPDRRVADHPECVATYPSPKDGLC